MTSSSSDIRWSCGLLPPRACGTTGGSGSLPPRPVLLPVLKANTQVKEDFNEGLEKVESVYCVLARNWVTTGMGAFVTYQSEAVAPLMELFADGSGLQH